MGFQQRFLVPIKSLSQFSEESLQVSYVGSIVAILILFCSWSANALCQNNIVDKKIDGLQMRIQLTIAGFTIQYFMSSTECIILKVYRKGRILGTATQSLWGRMDNVRFHVNQSVTLECFAKSGHFKHSAKPVGSSPLPQMPRYWKCIMCIIQDIFIWHFKYLHIEYILVEF